MPVLKDSMLYGTTLFGGTHNKGTIYRINTDASEYRTIYNFSNSNDGSVPIGSMLVDDTLLYGMASSQGSGFESTIFCIDPDGNNYSVLKQLADSEGYTPYGSLIQWEDTLFGMAAYGGDMSTFTNGCGTIFRIQKDGSNFEVINTFTGSESDGREPHGSLYLSGGILYGMTLWGGSEGLGTIFRINTDGSDFNLIHNFTGNTDDGSYPHASLCGSGNTLYGTTREGGAHYDGTIFSMEKDGNNFRVLHSFSGGQQGRFPFCTLTQNNHMLYGTTFYGGEYDKGTIFQIDTSGGNFTILHSFEDSNGQNPVSSLLLNDSKLYGVAPPGASIAGGILFAFDLTVPDIVPGISEEDDLSIYPNPVSGICHIDLNGPATSQLFIRIYNMKGKLVFEKSHPKTTSCSIDISGLSSGIYILKVTSEQLTYLGRILKE